MRSPAQRSRADVVPVLRNHDRATSLSLNLNLLTPPSQFCSARFSASFCEGALKSAPQIEYMTFRPLMVDAYAEWPAAAM
jgi:hypothetical protein